MKLTSLALLILCCVTPLRAQQSVTIPSTGGTVLVTAASAKLDTVTLPAIHDTVIKTDSLYWDSVSGAWNKTKPAPVLTKVTIAPKTVSLTTGAVQGFTAVATWNDNKPHPVTFLWAATGGSVTQSGGYTAGSVAGTFKVIANAANKADTAIVTVTVPPPPPSGVTFFTGNAESGGLAPWSTSYLPFGTGGIAAATSTLQAHSGTRSYKFEIPASGAPNNAHYSQLWGGGPQTSMGTPSGHYGSGYYSVWLYLDSGWNSTDRTNWNTMLGWMTGTGNAPRPMYDIGLRLSPGSGPLQLMFHLSSATSPDAGFANTAPNITGYNNVSNGYYFTTSSSPAGIVAFPRNQWVHVVVYVLMATSNGRITIWQDNVKIMDLTAPTLNTLRGAQGSNPAGDADLQFGIYGGPETGLQRLFADDFTITDFRPVP